MPELLTFLSSISGLLGSGALAIAIAAWVRSRPDMRRAEVEGKKVDLAGHAALDAGTQNHIDRLEKHIERQDKRIREIEERMEKCERERAEMRGEIVELRAALNSRGEIRQKAALVVAADKLENKLIREAGK